MIKVGWDSVLDIYVMASDFRPGTEYNDGISKFQWECIGLFIGLQVLFFWEGGGVGLIVPDKCYSEIVYITNCYVTMDFSAN